MSIWRSSSLIRPEWGLMRRRSAPVMARGGPSRRRRMAGGGVFPPRVAKGGITSSCSRAGGGYRTRPRIGGMIDDQDSLTHDGLTVAVRDVSVPIGLESLYEGDHLLEIAQVPGDRFVPVLRGRLRAAREPVVLRE